MHLGERDADPKSFQEIILKRIPSVYILQAKFLW